MEMHDLYLVSPELSMIALAVVVVGLGLINRAKSAAKLVALMGLAVPAIFVILLWGDISAQFSDSETAFLGTLIVDKFALFFKLIILSALALLILASNDYMNRFRAHQEEFIGLTLLASTGLMLLPASADLITIFLALELATLPVAALAAFTRTEIRSTEAGLKFLLLGAISSAVLLYGFAFIYGATGTLRLVSFESSVPTISMMITESSSSAPFGNFALMLGLILAISGFGFKLSIVPFHMWTPDVYEGAPTPVAAFLAVASKAAAFAVLLRLLYVGFGGVSLEWSLLFAGLAAVTMTVGNLGAMLQTNMKRLLGYSAIAHAGYILVGLASVSSRSQDIANADLGPTTVVFYIVAYAVMNLAAFFAVIAISQRTGSELISDFAGLVRRSPWLTLAFTIALISLIGIPPTVGFMGKLFLFNAAVNADLIWLAVLGAINSVLAAYYYIRVVLSMYLGEVSSVDRIQTSAPTYIALAVVSTGIIVLGIMPSMLLELARTVVADLIRV